VISFSGRDAGLVQARSIGNAILDEREVLGDPDRIRALLRLVLTRFRSGVEPLLRAVSGQRETAGSGISVSRVAEISCSAPPPSPPPRISSISGNAERERDRAFAL